MLWPHGQAVKTPPFHGGIRGSIPLEATKKIERRNLFAFLLLYLLKGIESHLVRAPENQKIFGERSKRAQEQEFCQKLCMSAVCDEIPLEATKKIALLPSYFRSVWLWRLFFWVISRQTKIRVANFARTCIKFDKKLSEEISSLFCLFLK